MSTPHLHPDPDTVETTGGETMEHIYENFDALFRKLYTQGRRLDELEQRVDELTRRLNEREAETSRPLLRVVEPQETNGRVS